MIAHKLESAVRYCDKVLVMDKGSVSEFDTPARLLQLRDAEITGDSVFADMVRSLNIKQRERIISLIN
jgi:ABC-type multidrug transport system fused ATPase/permease subunit